MAPTTFTPERENLYRGLLGGVQLRSRREDGDNDADDIEGFDDDENLDGDGDASVEDTTLVGHFAIFNEWTEICSWYEGEFLERIAPGAFTKTIREHAAQVKVQYDHGADEWVGASPLGPIDVLREDKIGAYYEVPLLDTDYNRERVLPLLQGRLMSGEKRGSLLGASFRFRVVKDSWEMEPAVSAYNPKGLPERTVTEVRLFEFGPVVFPAYPAATAAASSGMRSLTDHYMDRRREARSNKFAAAATGTATTPTSVSEPRSHSVDPRWLRARAYLATH